MSDVDSLFPEFRKRLQKFMDARELTLTEVAKKAQVTRATLWRIAKRDGNPTLLNLARISQSLGVSVSALLGPAGTGADAGAEGSKGAEAFLAHATPADDRALSIYASACAALPERELHQKVEALRYPLPNELAEDAVTRALLDVFSSQQAWIDPAAFQRKKRLEDRIATRYSLPPCSRLPDDTPVRVIDLNPRLLALLRIHALGAVAAELVRSFRAPQGLAFADGFMSYAVHRFLRRGDLLGTPLVPLVYTPGYVQTELSGATLVGSLALSHLGYGIGSTIAMVELQRRLESVDLAITSCGPVELEPHSRLRRVLLGNRVMSEYYDFQKEVRQKRAVGDVLYHFLKADGKPARVKWSAGDLETAELGQLQNPGEDDPVIYAASLNCLARIADRGACLLIVHSVNRARVAHAALQRTRKPVNFLVTTREVAEAMLKLD